MKRLLHRVFGIYPGEGKNALRFIRLAIFWSFGCSIAETLSISIFIEKIGANYLPYSYVVTALVLVSVSCLFMYLLRITTPHNIFYKVLYFSAIVFGLFGLILLGSPPKWFWFVLQIGSRVILAALVASYWTFLSQYHDLQDAKRIYGIYNAAYFLGYVLSGTLINLILEKAGNAALFGVVFILMILSLLETRQIKIYVPSIEDDTNEGFFSGGKRIILSTLRLFYKSRYAIILVSMSLVIQLIRTTTEFSYMQTFEKIFDASENTLTQNIICSFLGKCKAYIAAANIILGMFFYGRFVRRIGLANMILIPPLFFFTLYSEWSIYNSLLVAIFAVVAIEAILYTVEDNNFNLLINAAPFKLQSVLRIINDSFFEPVGMLFSAIFLVFLQAYNIWFGLILSLIFFITSIITRHFYPLSILKNLKENAVHFERKFTDWMRHLSKKEQKEIQEDILDALKSDSETTKLLAFETLLASKNQKLLSSLIHHAESFSVDGKIKTLQLFDQSSFADNSKTIEMVDNFLNTTHSEDLTKWCNLYLAKRGLLHPEKVMHYLDSLDLFLRAIAIITLKQSKAKLPPETVALNKTIAAKELHLLLKFEDESEICLGLSILADINSTESIERVINFLDHRSLKVQIKAAETLAKLSNKSIAHLAFQIIEKMSETSDNKIRLCCLEALGKIGDSSTVRNIILASIFFRPNERRLTETIISDMGLKTVPILISIIKDTSLHDRSRILVGKILGRIALPQLQANLYDIIDKEISRAYFYYYFGHNIQKKYPEYDLHLLKNALLTGYQSAVDFIIYLLGAAGSIEDCDVIVHSLHSKNAKARSHAIETIEKNCANKIFRKIQPLIDDVPGESKLETYFSFGGFLPELTLSDLLKTLETSASLFDKAIAAHLRAKFRMPNWKESLRQQIKTCDGPLHHYAYELLET